MVKWSWPPFLIFTICRLYSVVVGSNPAECTQSLLSSAPLPPSTPLYPPPPSPKPLVSSGYLGLAPVKMYRP